jgi:hypothetical protein
VFILCSKTYRSVLFVCVDHLTLEFVLWLRNVAVLWEPAIVLLYEKECGCKLLCAVNEKPPDIAVMPDQTVLATVIRADT